MSKLPLSQRLREIRDRLDLIGDEGDSETVAEAIALARRHEQEAAAGAQVALEVDDGMTCSICADPIEPASEAFYHEEAGWTQPRAQGGTNALRGRQVTGRRAHARCVGRAAEQGSLVP